MQTLWPVKDVSCTIAQLLQQINDVFPLEAGTWGLEDYSFTLAGYDLLHYHVIKAALKDEDELVIKPLKWEDLRSRTVTGRDQISVDGRHLVDGVPFGRPAIRAPTRPEVRIPPRKKRRLLDGGELMIGDGGLTNGAEPYFASQQLLLEETANGAESDEEDDMEFVPDDLLNTPTDSEQDSWHSHASTSDSSGEEDNSDGSSSSDDSSSDSSSDSDEEEWEGIAKSKPSLLASKAGQTLTNGVTQALQRSSSTTNGKPAPQTSSAPTAPVSVGIPHEGTPSTQQRNARRRDAKRLSHAKRTGTVPQDATLADFRAWQQSDTDPFANAGERKQGEVDAAMDQANDTTDTSRHVTAKTVKVSTDQTSHRETSRAASESLLANKKRKAKKAQLAPETQPSLEERRQKLVAAINSGGIDVDGSLDTQEAPEQLTSKEQPAETEDPISSSAMTPSSTEPATRRAKLDLAGSQRLLYGSLGVRVPKTQTEKDALQKKLSDRANRKAVHIADTAEARGVSDPPASAKVSTENLATDTSDSWRDRINLTAVECVDENVTLFEPPFPFHQRWDPQYNRKGKKRVSGTYMENGANKKRKRGRQTSANEGYDKYNADGYGDALNYDDEEGEDDEYWEDGALLNGASDEEADAQDDFPPLPSDITTLPPIIASSEAKVNDIIVFTELACDESTGWQPRMATRTAKILEPAATDEGGCMIQLSTRDVKPPRYDEEGNRVWSKFEMPTEEGEVGTDQRVRGMVWGSLGDVRMLAKAEAAEEMGS